MFWRFLPILSHLLIGLIKLPRLEQRRLTDTSTRVCLLADIAAAVAVVGCFAQRIFQDRRTRHYYMPPNTVPASCQAHGKAEPRARVQQAE